MKFYRVSQQNAIQWDLVQNKVPFRQKRELNGICQKLSEVKTNTNDSVVEKFETEVVSFNKKEYVGSEKRMTLKSRTQRAMQRTRLTQSLQYSYCAPQNTLQWKSPSAGLIMSLMTHTLYWIGRQNHWKQGAKLQLCYKQIINLNPMWGSETEHRWRQVVQMGTNQQWFKNVMIFQLY